MRMTARRRLAAVCSVLVVLGGCATTSGEVTDETPVGANAAPATEDGTSDAESEDTGQQEPGVLSFGQTFKYDDGLAVTVSKPKNFKPSEYAFTSEDWAGYKKFKITVVNNTGETVDVSLFYVTMQSGNEEAEQVFDGENGLDGAPSTKLLDGRESTFAVGFGVADPDDMVMEVSPDLGIVYEGIIYATS